MARQADEPASFVCPRCGAKSYNPTDRLEGYCGRCHDWTGVEGSYVQAVVDVNLRPFIRHAHGEEPEHTHSLIEYANHRMMATPERDLVWLQ